MSTVAAIQMTSGHSVEDNLEAAAKLLREAKEAGAELACLPENFSFIGLKDADKLAVAEADGSGPVQQFLSETARALGLWILGGTTVIKGDSSRRVSNTSLLFDAQWQAGRALRQDPSVRRGHPGPQRAISRVDARRAGPKRWSSRIPPWVGWACPCATTCGFRSCTASLSRAGAEWLAMPAAFTVPTGRAHWETLLRARAIENLCYVVAPAQWGTHASGRETYGDTLIVDYWGQVLSPCQSGRRRDHGADSISVAAGRDA
jgi:predicted amidohydrolase